jgi:NAD(P)-dependent dehydrogenase (short-subunit alcohol dehydrogenase family)
MQGFDSNLLRGRKILVTGAGRGIGRACTEAALGCGAHVIAVDRGRADFEGLPDAEGLERWEADVTSQQFLERLGRLDVLDGLVNNAGTNRVGYMAEQSEQDLDAVISLNIRSPWLVSQAALPSLLRSGRASVVNMSSQMGHVGSPRRTLYCMSKHAIEGLTKAMAVELAESRIRVNTIAPTFVETPLTAPMLKDPAFSEFVMGMIPMRRLATTEEVAAACVYLLSDLSGSTTGSCLKVDGGWTAQ